MKKKAMGNGHWALGIRKMAPIPIPIPIESGSGEIRGRLVGHCSAHESLDGIGISLRAPQTPRPRNFTC